MEYVNMEKCCCPGKHVAFTVNRNGDSMKRPMAILAIDANDLAAFQLIQYELENARRKHPANGHQTAADHWPDDPVYQPQFWQKKQEKPSGP